MLYWITMQRGGRTIKDEPHEGVGRDNPLSSSFVPGFEMTPQERADLITFLKSLTDQTLLANPKFSDPQKKEP
jgi:cytochrome c peroxidase